MEVEKTKPQAKPKKKTPLMIQYDAIKEQHPNELLLFRMGDFYELFNEDAVLASKVLNITLTQRNKKAENSEWMCGFPHHAMEAPINKLLEAGHSVAVCDQLQDPAEAKGIVKRGVTLMLSPGVVFNTSQLDQEKSHYVFCFKKGLACWFEPSTGKAFFKKVKSLLEVKALILKIQPVEILSFSKEDKEELSFYTGAKFDISQNQKFEKALDLSPMDFVLYYIKHMQGEHALFGFTQWQEIKEEANLYLNPHFYKHMEVFESNDGDKNKSLFHVIKKTKTPGGTRLLRNWLESPLRDVSQIKARHQDIKKWQKDFLKLKKFRELLVNMGDLERRVARAGHSLGAPQDMIRLKRSLEVFLAAFTQETFKASLYETLQDLYQTLDQAIEEESVAQWQTKGQFIKKGFSKALDKLIEVSEGAQTEISNLEEREKAETGISSLKVRFNSVFGFYIEVTKTHKSKVPETYVRRQTLTNAERYTTAELSEIEERVLLAKSKKISLEKETFSEVKEKVRAALTALKAACELSNYEDLCSAMAYLCFEKNYSLPNFTNEKNLEVKEGFHPVVMEDLILKGKESFVTNDLSLTDDMSFYMITGPNMAGKSTLMRQIALTAFMGQAGLPVPAKEALLPIYESIFTRIGASDALSEGLSTFMVEMTETAEILKSASHKSLLVLDEIGRGTSSADGRALAKSIVFYILKNLNCHSLFATHYHELTQQALEFSQFKNIHMGYSEQKGEIYFTYKVKEGASQKSYGIEVAKLAGLPEEVIKMARTQQESFAETDNLLAEPVSQMSFDLVDESDELKEDLKSIKALEMTPMQALNKIIEWQEKFL